MFWQKLLLVGLLMGLGSVSAYGAQNTDCVPAGKVFIPENETWLTKVELIKKVSGKKVILLGEHHDNIEHHRWQLHTIIGVHVNNPELVLGFEMFPRQVQPVLDQWVAGELSEEEFLKASNWDEYWNFDPELYLPIFHYARMNSIPMHALNVDRSLIRKVGEKGWDDTPEDIKEGLSKPKPAKQGYREILASVFMQHGQAHGTEPSQEAMQEILDDPAFNRFVESQLVWDRAMAEAIAKGRRENDNATVIAVLGSGHMMYRFGVPDQLMDLKMPRSEVLIPWDTEFECEYITKDFSDAVIGLKSIRLSEKMAKTKPRLGVYLDHSDNGVLITKVLENSVAKENDIREGDIIVALAGKKVSEVNEVVEAVQAMLSGTWLPMKVIRDGKDVDIVVRFPAAND